MTAGPVPTRVGPGPAVGGTGSSRRTAWLAAATLAVLVAAVAHVRGAREHPNNQDRELDLLLARRVVAEGVLTDGARSPLFPLLLAPFQGGDPGFAMRARWVALATGGLAAAAAFLLVRRALGDRVAVASTLLLGPEWTFQVSRLRPEPVVAALLVAFTAALAAAVARRDAARRPLGALALAGVAAGLAHLGKGSGPLTIGAAAVVGVLAWRRRAALPLAVVVGVAALVASPLLVDAARRFGSPLHNANVAHVMWERAGEDQQWRWSVATPASWWAAEGVGGTLRRLGRGLSAVTHGPWLLATVVVVAVAADRRRRAADPSGARAVLAWGGVAVALVLAWAPPFAWYVPIANGRRYLFPVLPAAVAALIAAGDLLLARPGGRLAALGDRGARAVLAVAGRPAALALALLALGLAEVREATAPPDGGPRRPFDAATLEVAAALRRLPPGTRVLAGPAATVPSPWLVYPEVELVHLPSGLDAAAAAAWTAAHADAVLVSENLVTRRPVPFATWARLEPGPGPARVVEASPPASVERVPVPGADGRYLLYRVRR